eukprot:13146156-Ditylum_brightwellii.AAC.2
MDMESPFDQEEIPKMIQRLCLDTLDCYFPQPAKSQITENLFLALRKFKHSVQWKEYWKLKKVSEMKSTDKNDDATVVSESSQESTSIYIGLGTNLKPVNPTRRALIGPGKLEMFLYQFESALLEANNKEIP